MAWNFVCVVFQFIFYVLSPVTLSELVASKTANLGPDPPIQLVSSVPDSRSLAFRPWDNLTRGPEFNVVEASRPCPCNDSALCQPVNTTIKKEV